MIKWTYPRNTSSESWVRRRKGESWRPSFILQALEHGQVLSVVLGDRVDASPALQRLLLEPERSHHPRHTRVNVDDCQVQLIYRKWQTTTVSWMKEQEYLESCPASLHHADLLRSWSSGSYGLGGEAGREEVPQRETLTTKICFRSQKAPAGTTLLPLQLILFLSLLWPPGSSRWKHVCLWQQPWRVSRDVSSEVI